MNLETRNCQNCKKDFVIEPDDFSFYEKIKVPPPTFCPDCRLQRRIAFRNERTLYKRKCEMCSNDIISMYPADAKFPVYCRECWYSDKWDPRDYGQDFDFSKDTFSQFKQLLERVPRPALIGSKNTESPYMNYSMSLKNCYLAVGCSDDENCGYIYRTFNSKESFDGFGIVDSEYIYEGVQVAKGFRSSFSKDSENILDSTFLLNCRNVSHFFACANLRSGQYNLFNKEYSKEEYEKEIEEKYDVGSFAALQKTKEEAEKFFLKFPRRFAKIILASDSTGDDLAETKNCKHCFFIRTSQNLKYGFFATGMKECMDFTHADNAELVYESANIEQNYEEKFSLTSWFSRNIAYCDLCFSSSELFACIGLRNNKQYCILNKQYTKEEYEAIVPKIIEHMNEMPYTDKKGRIYKYGEFFPAELSPFAYNETVAQEYFPLTKEQATDKGYLWKNSETRQYAVTLTNDKMPDHIKDVQDNVVEQVIECAHKGECNEQCTRAFKVTSQELQFYKKMNVAIPRLCPNCRHHQRLKQRNPLKLWHRHCMNKGCVNEFETSYSPDRPEIVYCESCYQKEVY